eukprot:XP_014628632.1 peroxiredoxin PRX1, mitochondrial-like [Glycine max]
MPRSLHASNSPLFIISLAHVLINDTSNFSASKMPGLTIGDTIPNLQVETNQGKIKLHQFCADGWTILFSHPGDFTPVCTTELGKIARRFRKFEKRKGKKSEELKVKKGKKKKWKWEKEALELPRHRKSIRILPHHMVHHSIATLPLS